MYDVSNKPLIYRVRANSEDPPYHLTHKQRYPYKTKSQKNIYRVFIKGLHSVIKAYTSSMKFIRINDDTLYTQLETAAKEDGRSNTNMLEQVLHWYFGGAPYGISEGHKAKGLVGTLVGVTVNEDKPLKDVFVPTSQPAGNSFRQDNGTCKSCETPLRPDHKCQMKGCKFFGKVQ